MSKWESASSGAGNICRDNRAADSGGSGGMENSADRLSNGTVSGVLIGTYASDTLEGNDSNEIILAGPGDDEVYAGAGNDLAFGGVGLDFMRGGPGNDILYGGSGRDFLQGDADNDLLIGGAGDDRLYASEGGQDTLAGGPGHDYFMVGGNITPEGKITALDFRLGEDSLYATDYYGVTDVRSPNAGHDIELVFTDVRHPDNPAPGVSLVLAGVTASEIENFLGHPIDGGAGIGALFVGHIDLIGL